MSAAIGSERRSMSKKWALVVDDDPEILALIEAALEHPEFVVTTACDALQAFIQARDLKPFVVVADIQMPGENGTTILKRLRGDARVPRMPIIFMTGMSPDEAKKLLPGNDRSIGLLPKPIDLDLLRGIVWKLAGIPPPYRRTAE